eukprot:CAMPEP_0183536192 /NCGR_PEP_ID=MMETSP0371-20130417/28072_1 /TAXON_ID=268820 /ORGANISM="Peridinium aciculiferum, Strain PAER-2" /LENGTH=210 /DNA_ID=CAMNT_0025736763 /DNA_START=83 /DNA_END=712 /DNA_ORIENTATION=+
MHLQHGARARPYNFAAIAAVFAILVSVYKARPFAFAAFRHRMVMKRCRGTSLVTSHAAADANAMPSYTHEAGSHPINKWGGLSNVDRRVSGGGAKQLGEFLFELAQLAPCRFVVNGLSIMESTADMRAGRAVVDISTKPNGRSVLAFASKDGKFNLKLDADAIVEVVLEESEQTGRGIVHLLDDKRRKHLTAVMEGEDGQVHFEILRGRW